jgi:hypothetical protein
VPGDLGEAGPKPPLFGLHAEACRVLRPLRPAKTSVWLAAPTALTISKLRLSSSPSVGVQLMQSSIGQSKTIHRAEIDSAVELVDFCN